MPKELLNMDGHLTDTGFEVAREIRDDLDAIVVKLYLKGYSRQQLSRFLYELSDHLAAPLGVSIFPNKS